MDGPDEKYQLWVRIYPDDVAVDTFEPLLTDDEVKRGRLYWIDVWRAGGDKNRKLAAWRSLVGSHGSGRAAYVIDNYKPVNIPEEPVKALSNDVILVIPTEKETPLPLTEVPHVQAYWEAFWLADGKRSEEVAAMANLESAIGKARATTIVTDYRPANLDELPPKPLTKTDYRPAHLNGLPSNTSAKKQVVSVANVTFSEAKDTKRPLLVATGQGKCDA